jgi:mono/diheme cytochrome c family protein
MRKRTFVIFGAFAICFGLLLPYWAISRENERESTSGHVTRGFEREKKLFAQNCGACHTLGAAGTDGVVAPNLDELLGEGNVTANQARVRAAIENGVGGRMPKGILRGKDAKDVSIFVARVANPEGGQ